MVPCLHFCSFKPHNWRIRVSGDNLEHVPLNECLLSQYLLANGVAWWWLSLWLADEIYIQYFCSITNKGIGLCELNIPCCCSFTLKALMWRDASWLLWWSSERKCDAFVSELRTYCSFIKNGSTKQDNCCSDTCCVQHKITLPTERRKNGWLVWLSLLHFASARILWPVVLNCICCHHYRCCQINQDWNPWDYFKMFGRMLQPCCCRMYAFTKKMTFPVTNALKKVDALL